MKYLRSALVYCAPFVMIGGLAPAQEFGAVGTISLDAVSTKSLSVNNMSLQNRTFLCGGKAQAGTPISALADTSGTVTISAIPVTAKVLKATLFWTVLVDDQNSSIGQNIYFEGIGVAGSKIGTASESPCFPQPESIAYKADVTHSVVSPGNGAYRVSGFPVGGGSGSPFVEGVTLQVLWSDANGALMEDVLYHTNEGGTLAVTQGDHFSQEMIFKTNASGPVSGTLFEVIGNGQIAPENLRFDGPADDEINLDDTLDGSTVAFAAGTCPNSPVAAPQCFWDDDIWDVSAQLTNGATSATLSSGGGSDCLTWPALNLMVSTDEERVCEEGGEYVDAVCPEEGEYRNHGQYVSCVAHAAEVFLAGLPWEGSCPRDEIQSCIVNPRARSDVGKKQ